MEENRCPGCMKIKTGGNVCEHCGFKEAGSNESHQLAPGTVLDGKYLVGRVLGQGGFGITYLGWDKYLQTSVAIKEFYPSSLVARDTAMGPQVQCSMEFNERSFRLSRERFLREAKALTKFAYVPQIVQIKGYFQENNTAYIIMEFVKGRDLRDYIRMRGGRLTMKETMGILGPVMKALSIVHAQGLIHRDISPDNLILDPVHGAKLLDFGAVRTVEDPDAQGTVTKSTEAILKHGFAPPEQYRNRGDQGPWTDVYALCATFYYCLTGRVPTESLARMMGEDELDWDAVPELTPQQRWALKKGMRLLVKDRFATVEQLHEALLSTDPVPEEQKEETPKAEKPPKKRRGKGFGAVAAVLAVIVAAALWYFLRPANQPELQLAVPQETQAVETLPPEQTEAPEETQEQTQPQQPESPRLQSEQLDTGLDAPWVNNLMVVDPLDATSLNRDQVTVVIFHDNMDETPAWGWDLSQAQDRSVVCWLDGADYVHIAGEGGVNGAQACDRLFSGCFNLRSVTFGNGFHTDQATSMKNMFDGCKDLSSVDVENLNMAQVTDISRMFAGCATLTSLDVSGWNVGRLSNMNQAFSNCLNITGLDVGAWDTQSLTDMNGAFMGCSSLTGLDVSGWDMANVLDIGNAFSGCSALTALDVSRWDVSSVTDMSGLFYNCRQLQALDVSGWNVSRVTTLRETFRECRSLTSLDVADWQTRRVTDMNMTFAGCYGLKEIPVGTWDVTKVADYSNFMDSSMTINGKPWRNYFEQ